MARSGITLIGGPGSPDFCRSAMSSVTSCSMPSASVDASAASSARFRPTTAASTSASPTRGAASRTDRDEDDRAKHPAVGKSASHPRTGLRENKQRREPETASGDPILRGRHAQYAHPNPEGEGSEYTDDRPTERIPHFPEGIAERETLARIIGRRLVLYPCPCHSRCEESNHKADSPPHHLPVRQAPNRLCSGCEECSCGARQRGTGSARRQPRTDARRSFIATGWVIGPASSRLH